MILYGFGIFLEFVEKFGIQKVLIRNSLNTAGFKSSKIFNFCFEYFNIQNNSNCSDYFNIQKVHNREKVLNMPLYSKYPNAKIKCSNIKPKVVQNITPIVQHEQTQTNVKKK